MPVMSAQDFPEIILPIEAIETDPPNVWLTTQYGFDPDKWGMVGFTKEANRKRFVLGSRPGVLVVVSGGSRSPQPSLRRKIMGILQCTHEIGPARDLMEAGAWRAKEKRRWNYGVRVIRAWRVTPESMIHIDTFAPETTATGAYVHIGAAGERITSGEAQRIFELDLEEVPVFGGPPIVGSVPAAAPARDALSPSRAGPVSQSPFTVSEAEGPKHLYVLKLSGDPSVFLDRKTDGRVIYKVGFSHSPAIRCRILNASFPAGVFRWQVDCSTSDEGRDPLPTSGHALAGERKLKDTLSSMGESLGGEFFLAESLQVERAWRQALEQAVNWKAA